MWSAFIAYSCWRDASPTTHSSRAMAAQAHKFTELNNADTLVSEKLPRKTFSSVLNAPCAYTRITKLVCCIDGTWQRRGTHLSLEESGAGPYLYPALLWFSSAGGTGARGGLTQPRADSFTVSTVFKEIHGVPSFFTGTFL